MSSVHHPRPPRLPAGGLALAVVPQLVGPLGFRAAFASALVLAVVAVAVLAPGPRDRLRHAERASRPVLADAPGVLRDSRLHRLCVIYMASFGFSVVLGNWVVPLLTRAADYSEGPAGAVGSLILAAGVVSRPLGGWIARTHPRHVKTAGRAFLRDGLVKGKKWYSLTADYAFGHDLLKVSKRFMQANGGDFAGDDLVPTDAADSGSSRAARTRRPGPDSL